MAGRMRYKTGGSYKMMKKKTSMKGPRKGQSMKNGGRRMK